jgi:ATP-dependent RNA helicase SUPV3L1/SUV3
VGRLEGFRFAPEAGDPEPRAVLAAARRAVLETLPARLRMLAEEPDGAFTLRPDGRIAWRGAPVARLAPGPSAHQPSVEPLPAEFLDAHAREQLRRRLERFVAAELARDLGPLLRLADPAVESGPVRGLLYRLCESLGSLKREDAADLLSAIARADRRRLARLGIRIGREHVWVAGALTPDAVRLRALLWSIQAQSPAPELHKAGRKLMPAPPALGAEFCRAIGYRQAGAHAFRIDAYEALADAVHELARKGPFAASTRLRSLAGGAGPLASALVALGARADPQPNGATLYRLRRRAAPARTRGKAGRHRPDSPFASLGDLWGGR